MKISDIQRYDSRKMYEAYEKWPEIAQESYYLKDLQKIQFTTRPCSRQVHQSLPKRNKPGTNKKYYKAR